MSARLCVGERDRGLDAVGAALTEIFDRSRAVITSSRAPSASLAPRARPHARRPFCADGKDVPRLRDCRRCRANGLRIAVRAVDAPGPIALVNSVASGGALFSAVMRVAT
jgi:hypothetical protein